MLGVDPRVDVGSSVQDAPAEAEAEGAGAEVAPVAQGGDGCADDVGRLVDGEQFVAGVGDGGVLSVVPVGVLPSPGCKRWR